MKWFTKRKEYDNKTAKTYIILAAIAAMMLSLWIGVQQSVWFDEAYSVLVAKQAPAQIVHLASVDTHPPAYYLALHVWGSGFGWSELALRTLSVICFGVSVLVAGLLVQKLFGNRAAVFTVLLAVLSPLLLRYGFEIRMYAMASMLGVVATYVLIKARESIRQANWWWVLYAVLLTVGVLTLYYLAFLWLAHLVWLVYADRKKLKKPLSLKWLWAYLGAVVLFLPWLPKFLAQVNNGALASIGQPMNLEQMLGILTFNTIYKPLWQVNVLETVLVIVVAAWLVGSYLKLYRDNKNRQNLLLVTAYMVVPVVLLMLVSLLRPMYVERYLSHVALGLVMLAGVLIAFTTEKYKPQKQYIISLVGLGAVLIGTLNLVQVGNFNFQRMQKPNIGQAVKSVDCTNTSMVAADPYVATEVSYYLKPGCDLRFYSESATMGGGYAPFSDSPMRLADKAVPVLESKLYYAYYGAPQLILPAVYAKTSTVNYGGLTMEAYEIAN